MEITTKHYKSKNDIIVKYFFVPSVRKSDLLAVTFSGFHKETPKYNYINAQHEYDYNQLYILDDFGERASYYVFHEGANSVEVAITELIDYLTKEHKITRRLALGTSKGASAALFYALKYNFEYCFIGSPQFFVGDYLAKNTKNTELLSKIMSNSNIYEAQKDLNDYFLNILTKGNEKTKVYILVGAKETGFRNQLQPFIKLHPKLLRQQNTIVNVHQKIFEHSQIGYFYPEFIKECLIKENLISNLLISTVILEDSLLKVSASCFNDSVAVIIRDRKNKIQHKYESYVTKYSESFDIANLSPEHIVLEMYSYPYGQTKPIVRKQKIILR